jgi:hypothetical protein
MSLKITYWTGSKTNPNIAGAVILSESLTLSGTSAQSAATPTNAMYTSIYATETCTFDYGGTNPTADTTTDAFLGAGERVWLDAVPAFKVAGIQAT